MAGEKPMGSILAVIAAAKKKPDEMIG